MKVPTACFTVVFWNLLCCLDKRTSAWWRGLFYCSLSMSVFSQREEQTKFSLGQENSLDLVKNFFTLRYLLGSHFLPGKLFAKRDYSPKSNAQKKKCFYCNVTEQWVFRQELSPGDTFLGITASHIPCPAATHCYSHQCGCAALK